MQIVLQLGLLVIGFLLLMKGADWFVEGAAKIAEKFGIPQIVIGLTIVAMGTSLPEASVSITSALKGAPDITVGNVMGSNIMNVLLILGVTALICRIPVKKQTWLYEIPFVILVTIVISVAGLSNHMLDRFDGIILWGLMIIYILYLRWRVKLGDELEEAPGAGEDTPVWKMLLLIIVGIALITIGSNITIDSATSIARFVGVSERIIGLTIIAFGTSLPELVTSITAALKGKTDIAVGNIVGSNIFNILFVAGTTALISPVAYPAAFLYDSIMAIGTVVLLFLCVLPKKRLNKVSGIIMLLAYTAYVIRLFIV